MQDLRRPLGLVLAGGGALGSWQAACLQRLTAVRGLEFDHVLGFSAGALNGTAYCLGRTALLSTLWRDVENLRPLRLAPRLRPFSLFSAEPVRAILRRAGLDEEGCRRSLERRLTVVTLRVDDGVPVYSGFAPGGDPWEAPIEDCLLASCSIPYIFPPVRMRSGGRESWFIDGGIRGREPVSFACLAGCRDVVVLEMTRPDEIGRKVSWLTPVRRVDQLGREGVSAMVNGGVRALQARSPATRLFRLYPSRRLDFHMLSFRARDCGPAMELGAEDADRFLDAPGRRLA